MKTVSKVGCFFLILSIFLICFDHVFNFKYGDGIYEIEKFYEEKENSIDVIFLGSSHIFENVNTAVLWEEYGMAAFDLCGSVQPLWNSYYYMKEALKKQTPDVMVLDVYGAIQTSDYSDHSRIIKNNYGLRLSIDKMDSVKVSSPEELQRDYLLEYPTYHSRYSEIRASDFKKNQGNALYENWKGFGMNAATTQMNVPQNFVTDQSSVLLPKVETYLYKIIELAQKYQIPLLLIKTPYGAITQAHMQIYNRVAQIAEEKKVPFVNFNLCYDEMGLDFNTDFADGNHMNYKGNPKFTRYLAGYLKDNYDIHDRRGMDGYDSWELMAAYNDELIYNQELKEIQDIGTYIDKAYNNKNYITIYRMSGDYKNISNYDAVKNKLLSIGIDLDKTSGDSVWVMQNKEILYFDNNSHDFLWHRDLENDNTLTLSANVNMDSAIQVMLNRSTYQAVDNGLNMVIYDTKTWSVIESVGFGISGDTLVYGKSVE